MKRTGNDVSSWRKEGQRGEYLTLSLTEPYKRERADIGLRAN